jgi:hypothetical protein
MLPTACYVCGASANSTCQTCEQPCCDNHLKTVYALNGRELIWAALLVVHASGKKSQLRACAACHKKVRKKNILLLLAIPAILLVALVFTIVAALIARQVWPP